MWRLLAPQWDISLVLGTLGNLPFKPLMEYLIPLSHWSKTLPTFCQICQAGLEYSAVGTEFEGVSWIDHRSGFHACQLSDWHCAFAALNRDEKGSQMSHSLTAYNTGILKKLRVLFRKRLTLFFFESVESSWRSPMRYMICCFWLFPVFPATQKANLSTGNVEELFAYSYWVIAFPK